VLAEIELNKKELLQLQGTPLPQDASFDELRLKDVPQGTDVRPGQRLDPLLHYAGRAHVRFTDSPGRVKLTDLKPFVNRQAQTVSSTTGELTLDYGKGLLVINAPKAQGASGALHAAGKVDLEDITIASDLDLLNILALSLDDRPLRSSGRILLQVMSEEQTSGFQTEAVNSTTKRITNIGRDPWQVKNLRGTVSLKRPDSARLKVVPLDFNGQRSGSLGNAQEIQLQPTTLYYLIEM